MLALVLSSLKPTGLDNDGSIVCFLKLVVFNQFYNGLRKLVGNLKMVQEVKKLSTTEIVVKDIAYIRGRFVVRLPGRSNGTLLRRFCTAQALSRDGPRHLFVFTRFDVIPRVS